MRVFTITVATGNGRITYQAISATSIAALMAALDCFSGIACGITVTPA